MVCRALLKMPRAASRQLAQVPARQASLTRRLNCMTRCSQVLWLDQADAQAVSEGEEVTLMDWGNAIIRVRPSAGKVPCRNGSAVRI